MPSSSLWHGMTTEMRLPLYMEPPMGRRSRGRGVMCWLFRTTRRRRLEPSLVRRSARSVRMLRAVEQGGVVLLDGAVDAGVTVATGRVLENGRLGPLGPRQPPDRPSQLEASPLAQDLRHHAWVEQDVDGQEALVGAE